MRVSPKLCMSAPGHDCPLLVNVRIDHPTPQFYCPSVLIEVLNCDESGIPLPFDPAYSEKIQGDCPPWSLGEWHRDANGKIVETPSTTEPWTLVIDSAAKGWALGPGEWVVQVTLTQGKIKKVLLGRVTIKGESG